MHDDGTDSIYRAPESDTTFEPKGDLLAAYVGPKNADYYARRFDSFKSGGSAVSWNWPAFLFSSVWLLYRKMWLYGFLYWIVLPITLSLATAVVAELAGPVPAIWTNYGSWFLIGFVLLPMFANRLYFNHAQAKINKVASITSSAEQQATELVRIGGTSNIILVVVPLFLVAVVGVIAGISIPAYNDYTVRAQVSEGLSLAGGAKVAVTEYHQEHQFFPVDNVTAGLPDPQQLSGAYTESITVDDGEIVVRYGNQAHEILDGQELQLMPVIGDGGAINWSCSARTEIAAKHLPAACR